jgi:hypothetical protein
MNIEFRITEYLRLRNGSLLPLSMTNEKCEMIYGK